MLSQRASLALVTLELWSWRWTGPDLAPLSGLQRAALLELGVGGPRALGALARALATDRKTLPALLRGLEALGLIERRCSVPPHPTRTQLALTEAGGRWCEVWRCRRERELAALVGGLPPRARQVVADAAAVLERMG